MWTTIKTLFESKPFVVGLLGAAAAGGAIFGLNLNVLAVLAVITPIEILVGAQGWGADAAKHAADAQVKCHMASLELARSQRPQVELSKPSTDAAKTPQAGFAALRVMLLVLAIGGAIMAAGSVTVTNTGCATVQPVVTDVIDCAKAEAAVVSQGFSVMQIFAEVVADIEQIATQGLPAVYALVEKAIAHYGGDIVACAIDNYPATPPAAPSNAGSGIVTNPAPPLATLSASAMLKGSLLAEYFPGKHIKHAAAK